MTYLPEHDSAACGAIAPGYEKRSGIHACKTAHMVVLDDLTSLHTDKADLSWVLALLYIVARGLPVTTAQVALSLQGDMKRIPVTSVREHEPQMKRRVLFLITKKFNAQCPALATGLRAIEQMDSSCWRVKLTDDIAAPIENTTTQAAGGAHGNARRQPAAPRVKQRQPAAPKHRGGRPATAGKEVEVHVSDLAVMWLWLRNNRRTVNARYTRMCWRRDLPRAM